MRFDSSGRVSTGMFDENWTRYVVKMATGAGKTKVMGLTWFGVTSITLRNSQFTFKKLLVIAPNIIVLNRLRKDFDGLKMFLTSLLFLKMDMPTEIGKTIFQLTLHIQDDLKPITESGKFFLTNIHRDF
jgi:type III restriction enzyme